MKKMLNISLLGLASAGLVPTLQAAERPNVVIILADDLGYGDIGCYGHPNIKTPNIDRMATEGMRLTQYYSGAAVSTPSRAAMLTGRYSVRTGMWGDTYSVLFPDTPGGLPTDETTFAQIVKTQGYKTGCVGKWHLGYKDPHMPWNFGFDYYYGVPYANNFRPLPLMENARVVEDSTDQHLLTQKYTQKAMQFITESAKAKKPFLLYYASNAPHVPLAASKDFDGKSRRGIYGSVVEELDWSVGEVLKALKKSGVDKNTLVIFTSDNGPWLSMKMRGGSSGLLHGGKGSSWEGGFRVPAVVRYPKVVKAGTTCYNMCSAMDLFTTIVLMSGAKVPTDRPIDGVNLMPMLKNPEESVRNELAFYRGSELAAIRRGTWKAQFRNYAEWYRAQDVENNHQPLLFNMEYDPSETLDVSARHPEILRQLTDLKTSYEQQVNVRPSVNDTRPANNDTKKTE